MNEKPHDSNSRDFDDARLTAYALGQLDPADRVAVEQWLAELGGARADQIRRTIDETRLVGAGLIEAARGDPGPPPSPALRVAIEQRLQAVEQMESEADPEPAAVVRPRSGRRRWLALAAAACLLAAAVPAAFWMAARGPLARHGEVAYELARAPALESHSEPSGPLAAEAPADALVVGQKRDEASFEDPDSRLYTMPSQEKAPDAAGATVAVQLEGIEAKKDSGVYVGRALAGREKAMKGAVMKAYGGSGGGGGYRYTPGKPAPQPAYEQPEGGRGVSIYAGKAEAASQPEAELGQRGGQLHRIAGPGAEAERQAPTRLGTGVYPVDDLAVPRQAEAKESPARKADQRANVEALANNRTINESLARDGSTPLMYRPGGSLGQTEMHRPVRSWGELDQQAPGTEQYEPIVENEFLSAADEPLSTFSIDVDTASYANVRRFLVEGRLPPPAAVRIEEMVNYFPYDYPEPDGEHPFSVNMEVAQCPWNGDHRLVRIGLKGHEIHRKERGPSNLVFLLDVSGSMSDQNKLPLVKEAMRMLVDQLGEDDRVAIVTYAGNAGLALESTNGENEKQILRAIDALAAGGSTHGSAGIQLAYEQATEHFLPDGTNRVILATDGDLNVGVTDDDQLVKLIRQKAKSGVFLTVLGFGTGNLKDAKLEKLADHGNGSYAYIDSLREAYKVLVQQATGSLVTIAKDVKIQIEFNPAEVDRYRLIGYENRLLAARDFANDKKDAGEIGAGHTVTALYEIVPKRPGARGQGLGARDEGLGDRTPNSQPSTRNPQPATLNLPPLKYQRTAKPELTAEAGSGELLSLRLRYKQPQAGTSELIETTVKESGRRFGEASAEFRFAAAVASFGMVLRGSLPDEEASNLGLAAVEEFAAGALGEDRDGYRREFVDLVRQAGAISAASNLAGPGVSGSRRQIRPEAAEAAEPAQTELRSLPAQPQQPSQP